MNVLTVPIDDLTPDPANARRHGDRSVAAVKNSLRRFGQQKPIIVDSAHTVRAGNGTLAAARALGWKQVQVVVSDLSEADLRAYAIADNRTADLSEFDAAVLAGYLADDELGDVGFTEAEIRQAIEKADGAERPVKPKPLKLTPDQYVVVRRAIDALKEREGDPDVSDGQALELICADFAAGGT